MTLPPCPADTARTRLLHRAAVRCRAEGPDLPATRVPRPEDPVAAWLGDKVAARLALVGVLRLDDLLRWITGHGEHWHRTVPRIGPVAALRIVRWLDAHQAALGALPESARVRPGRIASAVACCAIVPLERFVAPPGLDGSTGGNRAPVRRCRFAAGDDSQAVAAWLALRAAADHTARAYRKEAERFLLWAVLARGKPMSSLDAGDCRAYAEFLRAPEAGWTGPRNAQREGDGWRPFEGPLSARSVATAVTIVRSMCNWLTRQRYLDANPWEDVRAGAVDAGPQPLRALTAPQWRRVALWLDDALPPVAASRRLRLVLWLAYATGLRLAERAAARLGWLRRGSSGSGPAAWSIVVPTGPSGARELPLSEPVILGLRACLTDRGLMADPLENDPDTALIARLNAEGPLSAARLYEVLAQAFERCASDVAALDPVAADRIRAASARWLRHTHGLHAIEQGMPPGLLQSRLGLLSPASVSVYQAAAELPAARAV